ncbi:MAG TPA: tetratricopeptide repeat protein, partial [Bacteroidales bacterium]|nr:tetratricopeptide repeat protein [Bacteroidales bacterium]
MGSPQDNQRASFPITATILTATGILMVLFSLQGQERMDTLRHAESLAYGGELGLATDLCSAYCDGHPRDVQSLRTCGRIAYWAGRLRLAERMLTNAYEQAPQDERLLAEYLEILARTGRLARARAVERALPTTLAPEAALSRSRALIAYYSGEPGQARQFMKAAMEGSTGNQENIRLAAEIEEAGSPLLVAGISLMKDDQPLGGFRPALGYSQHVKSWLNPGIQVEFPFWISDTRRWHSA